MKCLNCNRLMRLLGTNTNLYECPFCGRAGVKRAGQIIAQSGATVLAVPRQSHPKHE